MSKNEAYFQNNLALWNELTEINKNSGFYNLSDFLSGKTSLKPIEIEEMGHVKGKKILHLQCHFGMDSLSWARMGAKVTGVDFSDRAIETAKGLGRELNLDAEFICCNIFDLKNRLDDKFDIVFTSYGVLAWINNLAEWGSIINHFLKEGGFFYIVEIHPFSNVFENEEHTKDLKVSYPYFYKIEPEKYGPDMSYSDDVKASHPSYEWVYSMGDVINCLISQGLKIEFLHEFPFCCYKKFPFMEEKNGWWDLKENMGEIPLLFSLKAVK